MQTCVFVAAGAALAILFFGATPSLAQVTILNVAHDARSYGLAAGGVADGSNPSTIINNPAVAGRLHGAYLGGYSGEFLPDLVNDVNLKGTMLSGGYPVYTDDVVIRVGGEVRFAKLSFGESILTDTQGTPLGYFPSYEEYYSVTAAVALEFRHALHVGIGSTYKALSSQYALWSVPPAKGDGSAYDVGLLLTYSSSNPSGWSFTPALGVSLRNLGSDIEFLGYGSERLGRHNAYGASIQIESPCTTLLASSVPTFAMVLNVDLENSENSDKAYSAGLELGFFRVIFARLGFVGYQDYDPKTLTFGIGAGVPFRAYTIRFDYSAVPLTVIDGHYSDRENKLALTLGWIPQQAVESN